MPVPGPHMMTGAGGIGGEAEVAGGDGGGDGAVLPWPAGRGSCWRCPSGVRPRRWACTTETQRCTWPGVARIAGGDRVEAGLEDRQALDEIAQRRARRGEGLDEIEQVGIRGLGVVVAVGQLAQGRGVVGMSRGHCHEVGGAVVRAGDVEMGGEGLADRAGGAVMAGDRLLAGGAEGGEQGLRRGRDRWG